MRYACSYSCLVSFSIWGFVCQKLIYKAWTTNHIPYITTNVITHDDVIKWTNFTRYWPFVRRVQRLPVNSPLKGQLGGALMFFLIWAWINGWASNREAGDLRRQRPHYDVTVMLIDTPTTFPDIHVLIYFYMHLKFLIGDMNNSRSTHRELDFRYQIYIWESEKHPVTCTHLHNAFLIC